MYTSYLLVRVGNHAQEIEYHHLDWAPERKSVDRFRSPIRSFTCELYSLAVSASMVASISVHDIGINFLTKVTFVPGGDKSLDNIPFSWIRSLSCITLPDIGSILS